jgi:hypothetical protein
VSVEIAADEVFLPAKIQPNAEPDVRDASGEQAAQA